MLSGKGHAMWKFLDSYRHYRTKGGHGRGHAVYRALYFEIQHREPKYLCFKDWLERRFGIGLCYHDWCLRRWNYQYRCPRHQIDP